MFGKWREATARRIENLEYDRDWLRDRLNAALDRVSALEADRPLQWPNDLGVWYANYRGKRQQVFVTRSGDKFGYRVTTTDNCCWDKDEVDAPASYSREA